MAPCTKPIRWGNDRSVAGATRWAAVYDRLCERAYDIARAQLLPDLRNSQYDYAETVHSALKGEGRWLDLGCGHDLLPAWLARSHRELDLTRWVVVGIDRDQQAVQRHGELNWRVIGDIEALPFRDESFCLVTANMVLEHVEDPDALFRELRRIATPDGRVIIHTPNAQGYTTRLTRLLPQRLVAPLAKLLLQRKESDIYRTYYRANSGATLTNVSTQGAFAIESLRYVDASPQFIRMPPLMIAELLLIRMLRHRLLAHGRACILAVLRKAKPADRRL